MRANFARSLLLCFCLILFLAGFSGAVPTSLLTQEFPSEISTTNGSSGLAPVIIVPGVAGTQLWAQVEEFSSAWYCHKKSDWFLAWLSVEQVIADQCMLDHMRLTYNEATGHYVNNAGVNIDAHRGFPSTQSIQWMDPSAKFATKYFNQMVSAFEKEGWKDAESIFGVPYDWRMSIDGLQDTLSQMTTLVEKSVAASGKKAVVVSHSMGCLLTWWWLTQVVDEAWIDQHIDTWVPASGPFGGAMPGLLALISGYTFGAPLPHAWFKEALVTMPSLPWLLPVPEFWPSGTYVTSKDGSFGIQDISQILDLTNSSSAVGNFGRVKQFYYDGRQSKPSPNLKVHCFIGNGVDTDEKLSYPKNHFSDPSISSPDVVTGDGDGTVNTVSLELCSRFADVVTRMPGAGHETVVQTDSMITTVVEIAQAVSNNA